MENELINSKDYYTLAIDIFKVLNLERERRNMDGLQYLEEIMVKYQKLVEKSNLYEKKINDQLIPINPKLMHIRPLTPRKSLTEDQQSKGLKKDESLLFEMVDTSSGESSLDGNDNNV